MRGSRQSAYARYRGCLQKMWFSGRDAALYFAHRHRHHDQRAYHCPHGCGGWHLTKKPKSGW